MDLLLVLLAIDWHAQLGGFGERPHRESAEPAGLDQAGCGVGDPKPATGFRSFAQPCLRRGCLQGCPHHLPGPNPSVESKGPYHTDSLMRLPLIWRPAPTAGVAAAEVNDPVGQLDLAATFCEIAGVPVADWIEGSPLPTADGEPGRERVLCEWDNQQPSIGMHMRSIYRDGWLYDSLPETFTRLEVAAPA
jgi:hypothetical protein